MDGKRGSVALLLSINLVKKHFSDEDHWGEHTWSGSLLIVLSINPS